jgi:hypothetical protein
MGDATRHALSQVTGLAKHFTPETLRAHLLSRSVRTPSGCLEYQGYAANPRVYQKLSSRAWAHVAAYAAFIGDYDPTLDVEHSCDNPPCIEPTHLRQMTHAENMRRRAGRTNRSSCDHPRERDDLGRLKRCRLCNAENQRRWQQRQAGVPVIELEQFRPWVIDPPEPLFDLVG